MKSSFTGLQHHCLRPGTSAQLVQFENGGLRSERRFCGSALQYQLGGLNDAFGLTGASVPRDPLDLPLRVIAETGRQPPLPLTLSPEPQIHCKKEFARAQRGLL